MTDNRVGNEYSHVSPKGIASGVSPIANIRPDTRGLEAKLVKLIGESMDRASFDTRNFAYLLSLQPGSIQGVFMQSFLAYLETLVHKMNTDTYTDDEYSLCVLAMRMQEGIDTYE